MRSHRPWFRPVVAVSAALATAVALHTGAAPAAAAPVSRNAAVAEDSFYLPPPVPVGAHPGDLLRWRARPYRPVDPGGHPGTAYQVLYVTTGVHGDLIPASGVVIVPDRRAAGSPVVGVAHGTTGMADRCAPSRAFSGSGDPILTPYQVFLDDTVKAGWVTAAPDYVGLGIPGSHTYSVTIEQGRATLDAVRAAYRLPPAHVPPDAKAAVMGYSQGGLSAAAAAEYQPTYAPELRLVGAVAGGVPADMVLMGQKLDKALGSGLILMGVIGYDAAYPELGERALLNATGRKLAVGIDESCLTETILNNLFKPVSEYLTTNPIDVPQLRSVFVANSLGHTPPRVPVMVYQAQQDEAVPYDGAAALRKQWCAEGAAVTWKDYVGEHLMVAFAAQPDALRFVSQRFADRPARGNCAA